MIRYLLLVLALSLCGSATAASERRAGEIVAEQGQVVADDGRTVRFEIGTLYVPENRAVAGSRIIGVGFARIRAVPATGAPPVFLLPGGPGNSYLNAFTDSDEAGRLQLAGVLPYTAAGDVVVVDQRGFSRRGEVLELARAPLSRDRPRTAEAEAAAMQALATTAVAAHPDKDLSGYNIVQCAADVDDLRRALGYRRISLSGQSFGSQWSFAILRLYPGLVARALLTGVEPLAKNFDMPSQVFAALQRIAWDADRDPLLAPHLPAGGVMRALEAVRLRLAQGPVTVSLPDDGGAQPVVLGLYDFQASLLRAAAGWPAFVLDVYHGRYENWAREAVRQRENAPPARLIQPLVDSAMGASAERRQMLRTDPALPAIGGADFEPLLASAWPTAEMTDAFREPVQDLTPVVLMNGDWDTSTPVENMLGTLAYFPNGRAIVVHRAGHQTRAALFRQEPALLARLVTFLRTGSMRGLPSEAWFPVPAFQEPRQ